MINIIITAVCHILGFPDGSAVKNPPECRRRRRHRFDPWVRKIPWRWNGKQLQYSCLENPMDRGSWQAAVHGVAENRTWLSYWAGTNGLYRKGFPGGWVVKNPPASTGDSGSIPRWGRSCGKGNVNPLQYSCLGNHKDRRTWQVTVLGSHKRWT